MSFSLFFLLAVFLDLLFGDPYWFPHPVRIIGWLCVKGETFFRGFRFCNKSSKGLRHAGLYTLVAIVLITGITLFTIFLLCHLMSVWLEILIAIFFLYTAIAIKDLAKHSTKVYLSLKKCDIVAARENIQMIVGRDTAALDSAGIARACVETIAENMADGIIAPIFWATTMATLYKILHIETLLPPMLTLQPISIAALGALLYKVCNTMDSMFGYKNAKYIDFGRYPALFDDIVNYIPARLTAIFIIMAAFFLRLNTLNAIKIFWRDCNNHSSPNAGFPEAAMAGALDVMLGGNSFYFGELVQKPTIGDNNRNITFNDILVANRLIYIVTSIYIVISLPLCSILLLNAS